MDEMSSMNRIEKLPLSQINPQNFIYFDSYSFHFQNSSLYIESDCYSLLSSSHPIVRNHLYHLHCQCEAFNQHE